MKRVSIPVSSIWRGLFGLATRVSLRLGIIHLRFLWTLESTNVRANITVDKDPGNRVLRREHLRAVQMGKTFIDQSVYDSLLFLAVQLLGLQAAIVAVEYIESDASTSYLQLHPLLNLAAHLAYGRA